MKQKLRGNQTTRPTIKLNNLARILWVVEEQCFSDIYLTDTAIFLAAQIKREKSRLN